MPKLRVNANISKRARGGDIVTNYEGETFNCTNAADNAIEWIKKNKKKIHKNDGSGCIIVKFVKDY